MKKLQIHIILVLLTCIISSGTITAIIDHPTQIIQPTYRVLPDKTEN